MTSGDDAYILNLCTNFWHCMYASDVVLIKCLLVVDFHSGQGVCRYNCKFILNWNCKVRNMRNSQNIIETVLPFKKKNDC